jgi:hypothetical protein
VASIDAFDLTRCAPLQRTIIESAVQRCAFDFTRVLPRLRAETSRELVPVTFEDLSRFNRATDPERAHPAVPVVEPAPRAHGGEDHGVRRATLGLFYYDGRIVVHAGLVTQPELAAEVFLAEAAHLVDRYFLTPEQRRAIWEVWHPGEQTAEHDRAHGWAAPFVDWQGEMDRPGTPEVGYFDSGLEGWMSAFTRAFAPEVPVTLDQPFAHRTRAEEAAEIRRIVAPDLDPQPKPEPEPEPSFCGSRFGYAYHKVGAHWWVVCPRMFDSREAAEVAGLRPCRICKP